MTTPQIPDFEKYMPFTVQFYHGTYADMTPAPGTKNITPYAPNTVDIPPGVYQISMTYDQPAQARLMVRDARKGAWTNPVSLPAEGAANVPRTTRPIQLSMMQGARIAINVVPVPPEGAPGDASLLIVPVPPKTT